MLWWIVVAPALAGTIQVQAELPIGVKLDEAWITHSGTTVTMTDVAEGLHRVTVCNLVGKPVATADVRVGEEPVQLRFAERRLERVESPAPATDEAAVEDGPTPMDPTTFSALQRDMLAGSLKVRKTRLAEAVAAHWFQMRQVEGLVGAFEHLDDRVEAAELLAPRTVDPENVGALDHVFPTGAHRDRARAAFQTP